MRQPRPWLAVGLAAVALATVCILEAEQEWHNAGTGVVLMRARRNPAGSIASISPAEGPFGGHDTVTITGTALLSGGMNDIAKVSLKGVPVAKVLSAAANKIVVLTGTMDSERLPGSGDVEVISHSRGSTKVKHAYEYKRAPRIVEVQPDNGAHIGGTRLAIRGENLCRRNEKITVKVCGQPAKAVTCNGQMIMATTRAFKPSIGHSGRQCSVHIHSKVFGSSVTHRAFTYRAAPVILHVTPTEGRFSGGNEIRIAGSDLTSGQGRAEESVTVTIGGKKAAVTEYTPNMVAVKVPRHLGKTGFVDIKVHSKRHGTSRATGKYRVLKKPLIAHMSQATGRANGGEHLTLTGSGLGHGDIKHVRIGGHLATILYADQRGRKIKVLTPKFPSEDEGKTLSVKAYSARRGIAVYKIGFKVSHRGHIHKITPRRAPASGGTTVTINGENLGEGAEDVRLVKINGVRVNILKASAKQIVVKTRESPPGTKGSVRVYSRRHGVTVSAPAMVFEISKTPQITSVQPAMSGRAGGTLVTLQGHRLCYGSCKDLEHIRVGNARITQFVSKSAERIVFRTPTSTAAGDGPHTIVVRSKLYGDAEAPSSLSYLAAGAAGVASPTDVPLNGKSHVVITGSNLGVGEEYRVLLAGVEAKVLTASARKIEVQAGSAHALMKKNKLVPGEDGLRGNIIIETLNNGKATGMDTQVQFQYNTECRIERVDTLQGPVDGEVDVRISGHNLGMGDEEIFINGKIADNGLTVRKRQGSDVREVRVRSHTSGATPASVMVQSPRTGKCQWARQAKAKVGK
jgi:hypothetical protein